MMEEESQEQRPPCQYTVEELKAAVLQAEADYAAGRYYIDEEFWALIEQELPWLRE